MKSHSDFIPEPFIGFSLAIMLQLFVSLLILSGISALLAFFLEIARAYVADYGECRITVNQEKDLPVQGGSPLLFSLMDEGIFVPSACGGRGTCALCKVKVMEGGGPVLPTETPYLSQDEIQEKVRLSCQVKVKGDLAIEIPEELFLIREYRVRVTEMEDLTPDIKGIHLEILDAEEGMPFKPGQYLQLHIPEYGRSGGPEFRAYSIASPAFENTRIQLIITKMPEGVVSTYVHDHLKVDQELKIVGPYGDFHLQPSDRDILMIATGSGIAPIKSMLHQMENDQIPNKTTFFFGDRRPFDLLFHDLMREFENKLPDFTYIPTLSRTTDEDRWDGERGRVTDLIAKYVPDQAPIDVYICGSPAMVQSSVDLLVQKGIAEDQILFDKFE
jgi:Na+-transporting NADH:ubiquinone oxidoreductase subunit F